MGGWLGGGVGIEGEKVGRTCQDHDDCDDDDGGDNDDAGWRK